MHRKRVTSELHDIYFRLMTIKHAIPKIEWAIEWTLNYYITRSRQKVRRLDIRRVRDEMWLGKPHPTEGALGNPDGVKGPDQLVIRCSRESQQSGPLGLRLSI